MDSETLVFALLTLGIVAGSGVLLAGVERYGNTVVAVGGLVMVASILGMAWYVTGLEGPEGGEHGH